MNKDDIPDNSINLTAIVDGEVMRLSSGYKFAKDFDPEQAAYFSALLDGLLIALEVTPEYFIKLAQAGYAYESMQEALRDQEEQELMDSLPDADNLIKMRTRGGVQ